MFEGPLPPLMHELYLYKNILPDVRVTAILKRNVLGYKEYESKATVIGIKASTEVRIWMISRFGDVGITSNLSKSAIGYSHRVGRAIFHQDLDDPNDVLASEYFETVNFPKDGPIVVAYVTKGIWYCRLCYSENKAEPTKVRTRIKCTNCARESFIDPQKG